MAQYNSPVCPGSPIIGPEREAAIVSALETASVPNCGTSGKVKLQRDDEGHVTLSLMEALAEVCRCSIFCSQYCFFLISNFVRKKAKPVV
jgi:hypothetical protein